MSEFTYDVPDIKSGILLLPKFEADKVQVAYVENIGDKEVMVWIGLANPKPGNNRYQLLPNTGEGFIYKGQSVRVATKKGEGKIKISFENFSR